MSEVALIVETLKRLLKEREITQYEVAEVLGLSVARVKQIYASNDFSLQRLVSICNELLGMDLADLVEIAQHRQDAIESLTEEQERQLVANERLLMVAVSVMQNWTPTEIVETYDITKAECKKHLNVLESLHLISTNSQEKVKLLIDRNFQWIPDGPLEQFFRRQIQTDFLDASFNGPREIRMYRTGSLTAASADEMIGRVEKVIATFMDYDRSDTKLDIDKREGYSFIIAMRPWLMPNFVKMLRNQSSP